MNMMQFLDHVKSLGVMLWLEEEDRLRFRAEKGVMTDDIKDQIRTLRPDIIAFFKQLATEPATPSRTTLVKAPEGLPLPLSFAQERLWFIEQLQPGNTVYLIPKGLLLRGALDPALLERCIDAIVARQHSLRTAFSAVDGVPRQIVRDHVPWRLDLVDLAGANDQEPCRATLAARFFARPFDLGIAPLFRALLLRSNPREHALLLSIHHMVADDWSTAVFVRELTALYQAFSNGAPSPLPPLALQYSDYAWHQRNQAFDLTAQLDYWRARLTDLPLLPLPCDHPRPPRQTHRGANHGFLIAPELLAELKQLARQHNASLYMVLLAAFNVLLHGYSHARDIGVCSSVGHRNKPDLEGLIGMFVNLVIMRTRIAPQAPFSELLLQVRQVCLEAYDHADAPFEKVVEVCKPTRDTSRHPLAQVQLIYTTAPKSTLTLAGLEILPLAASGTVAKMDLTCGFNETARGLLVGLEYNRDLFDGDTVTRMGEYLLDILTKISTGADPTVHDLFALTQSDRVAWEAINAVTAAYPRERSVDAVFRDQVAAHGQLAALLEEGHVWTYAALDRTVAAVCTYLGTVGVSPGARVGLCLPSGAPAVICMLATLRLGAAYVPMDSSYPLERLSFMLQDAEIGCVIADRQTIDLLPADQLRFILTLIYEEDLVDLPDPVGEPPEIPAEFPAYVIYTSGSTGKPKGVVCNQRNIVRLVKNTNYLQPKPGNVLLQASSISFDASTLEIWGALLNGATLAFFAGRDLDLLGACLRHYAVDTLWLTAQHFHVMVDDYLDDLAPVTQLLAGGDALSLTHVRSFLGAYPAARLINGYGPTENTTFTCCCDLSHGGLLAQSVAIGTPIANTSVHILDPCGRLVPVGVVGELCTGGDGLASGYLARPALTAEKFVPNPFGPAGARLYRSGDLARLRSDGLFEFLGRRDNQVKVRGFRIELDEIVAALHHCAGVREAAVTVVAEGHHKSLVAYLVGDGAPPDLAAVRAYLQQRLPDYMVPATMLVLDALPVTSQGKLDRQALAALGTTPRPRQVRTPQSPEERLLAAVWQEVFSRADVGIDENFFELGGDSLLSLKVKASAARAGLHFDLQSIFEHPTIEGLAPYCRFLDSTQDQGYSPFCLISNEDRALLDDAVEDAFPLSHMQMGMLFHSAFTPDSALYHDVIYYQLAMPFREDAVQAALRELAAHHETLRVSFEMDRFSVPLQLVARRAEIPLAIIDLRDEADWQHAYDTWLDQQKRKPFDWRTPPLLAVYVHLLPDGFRCSFSFHHAILDGWSEALLFMVFLRSLLHDAKEPASGRMPRLGRFIQLERQAIADQRSKAFWEDLLRNRPSTAFSLPGDGDTEGQAAQDRVPVDLDESLSQGLHELSRRLELPLKSVLMAVHFRVLGLLSGSRDLITGVVANGRPEEEGGDRLLGLFLNTLPYRFQLASESWESLIARVFRLETAVLPHRRCPLPLLMKLAGDGPLFETHFNFTHFHVLNQLGGSGAAQVVRGRGGATENSMALVVDFAIHPGSDRIRASLGYDRTRYSALRIAYIGQTYRQVIAAMVQGPLDDHLAVDLLPQEHRERLAVWNQTEWDHGLGNNIAAAFERLAVADPKRTAILAEKTCYTRDTLNRAANRLARELRHRGIGPGTRVGLWLERDPHLVVAMLAVLKAGACYIPLNVAEAPGRLRAMLDDARPALVLAGHPLPLAGLGTDVLTLDHSLFPQRADHDLDQAAPPEAPAYCIYTSGSTGRPKGVVIPHRALINFAAEVGRQYGLRGNDRVLQFCAAIFDMSVKEIYGTLLSDGALVMAHHAHGLSPMELAALIEDWQITVLIFPAAYWHHWVAAFKAGEEPHFPSLRLVNSGGEQPNLALLERWRTTSGKHVHWINTYGPTETTVVATMFHLGRGAINDRVPMGKPLGNVRLHVLDEGGRPVPIGTRGSLHIGGRGLATGYLNQPARTALSFRPDPFATEPGSRLYATGDQVYFQEDGNLVFKGRVDHQVKLRGYRIETGEIEARLQELSGVSAAVVCLHTDESGGSALVAHVVGTRRNAEELREALHFNLPVYMIPDSFHFPDALPLTPGGKVDRAALPGPIVAESRLGQALGTLMEHRLAGYWREVLDLAVVSAADHFFALGGNSLSALRLMSRIERFMQISCPIVTLFRFPVLRDLAAHLEARRAATPLVPLNTGEGPTWFVFHPVGGELHWYLPLATAMEHRFAMYGLQALTPPADGTSLREIVTTYVTLIRTQQPHGPYRLLGWSLGGSLAMEAALQLQAAGERIAELVLVDTVGPYVAQTTTPVQRIKRFVVDRLGSLPDELAALPEELDRDAAMAVVGELLTRSGHLPAKETAMLERMFLTYSFFHQEVAAYRPTSTFAGSPTLIVCENTRRRNRENQWGTLDETLGWQAHCAAPVRLIEVAGHHYNLLREPQLMHWSPCLIGPPDPILTA